MIGLKCFIMHFIVSSKIVQDKITIVYEKFHLAYLDIDYERIINIKYELKETDNDEELQPSLTDNVSNENNDTLVMHRNLPSHDIIDERLSNNESITVDFHFSIADRKETSDDTLTGLHVVTLLLLASEFHAVLDFCQNYSVKVETISIQSDRNKTQEEFCDDPDVMATTNDGIIRRRIRSDGEIDYVVDVPSLETTYEIGDYTYLFMVQALPQQQTVIFYF